MKWDRKTVSELKKKNGLRNKHRYFSKGIGVSTVGQYAPVFRFAEFDVFFNNYNIIFVSEDKIFSLLGILCSSIFKYLLCNFENHSVAKNQIDILDTPLPYSFINRQVDKFVNTIILKMKENNSYDYISNEHSLIENIVSVLYNLTNEDLAEIDNWYFRRYPKLAGVIEKKLKAKESGKKEES